MNQKRVKNKTVTEYLGSDSLARLLRDSCRPMAKSERFKVVNEHTTWPHLRAFLRSECGPFEYVSFVSSLKNAQQAGGGDNSA